METDRIRLWITGATDNTARVSEIRVWPASVGNVPPLPIKLDLLSPVSIYLNQSGFNSGAPKRFTAPHATDGMAFTIRPADGGEPVFKGTIQGNIGDFTAFEPASGLEYVVATADGKTSVPFRIGPWWLERVTTQLAVDFMIDSRHYVGNERRSCGGSLAGAMTTTSAGSCTRGSALSFQPVRLRPSAAPDHLRSAETASFGENSSHPPPTRRISSNSSTGRGHHRHPTSPRAPEIPDRLFPLSCPPQDYLPAQNYQVSLICLR